MRDIARESAVSLATVHHYFGSKAELFKSCVDEMYDELEKLRDELLPAVAASDDFRSTVENAMRASYRFCLSHERAVRLMMRIVVDTGEVEASRRDAFLMPFLEHGAPLVAQAVGLTASEVRLKLLSLNHVVARFAMTAPAELVLVTDVRKQGEPVREQDIAQAQQLIEDHVVTLALDLLNLNVPMVPSLTA